MHNLFFLLRRESRSSRGHQAFHRIIKSSSEGLLKVLRLALINDSYCWVLRRLKVLYSTVMLRLARKRYMLSDNQAIAIPYRRTTALLQCTNSVAIKFVHQAHIFIRYLLLFGSLFLVLLVYLGLKLGSILGSA